MASSRETISGLDVREVKQHGVVTRDHLGLDVREVKQHGVTRDHLGLDVREVKQHDVVTRDHLGLDVREVKQHDITFAEIWTMRSVISTFYNFCHFHYVAQFAYHH